MSAVQLAARNATAEDLVKILNDQKAHKLDVVVPALNMRAQDGVIAVKGAEISPDGVTSLNGSYRPTEIFDEGLSAKLGIPRQYLRKMREERTDLYDKNVNGWLRGQVDPATGATIHAADERSFLLRLFRGDNGDEGVARAFLSDRYGITMDNLDILTAVMKGIRDAGQQPLVRVTDLRQQYGAHHIFSDDTAPIAFMGFDLRNSETGGGAYSLSPVVEMVKCTNGWTITREGIRKVHLGARLEQGHVRASAQTARKAGELVASETQDAVSQWLTTGYLEELIAG